MLKRLALFFVAEVETFESEASELARNEFEQALLAAFLSGNAHNYSYLLEAPPPGLTPRQVWLAESYIEANWDIAAHSRGAVGGGRRRRPQHLQVVQALSRLFADGVREARPAPARARNAQSTPSPAPPSRR